MTESTSNAIANAVSRIADGLEDGSILSRLCAGCGSFQRNVVQCLAEPMCRQIFRERVAYKSKKPPTRGE